MAPGVAAGGPLPIVFGPVITRRLGWSLGINHIRPKTCSYSCVYCQVGRTTRFARHDIRTSLLRADETETVISGSTDPVEGLVGILAVHPLTERTAREHLRSSGGDWSDIETLIGAGCVIRVDRDGTAYLRVDHTSHGARPALRAALTPSPGRQRARHPERTVRS